jgi:hypothetical protein
MNEAQALVQRRSPVQGQRAEAERSLVTASSGRLTNFYPLYNGSNDQVDPVLRVQPVLFQRILPRYDLSTSQTRDQGLGPMFADIPESPVPSLRRVSQGPEAAARAEAARRTRAEAKSAGTVVRNSVREPWLGQRVDLYA